MQVADKELASANSEIGLLVSVRNAEEAKIALSQGIAILDVKEPTNGSLGMPLASTVKDILEIVDPSQTTSVALGELVDLSESEVHRYLEYCDPAKKIDFVKIGLSKSTGVERRSIDDLLQKKLRNVIAVLPAHISLVAVAYVDIQAAKSPPIEVVIDTGQSLGCAMFLIDTFEKSGCSFLDHSTVDKIRSYREIVNSKGMSFVLAGSIVANLLPDVIKIGPQYIGIRGAACKSGKRTERLDKRSLEIFSGCLARCKKFGQFVGNP